MATKAAHKRLTREYAALAANPVEYITAHPAESNILEWHYVLTGPPDTPYHNGQYWGTLNFPPDYPFAPPAIRMHTPSGRFRCSERLCLSISDFHPKSFNPAWEVSTILLGVLSFMTSDEMTTGSISGTDAQRKEFAARSRWWNSTGGGSTDRRLGGTHAPVPSSNTRGFGSIKAGDGGKRFQEQWPELDEENWKWMEMHRTNPQTGECTIIAADQNSPADVTTLGKRTGTITPAVGPAVVGGQAARDAERGWVGKNWGKLAIAAVFAYVIAARLLSDVNS
ncbi:hypothetical protein LTR62_001642 [Meristemomyces frigidus]|uniref:UBC core domain-containing protein n=1 Tax=Meristemomyces frigidus TaxID=1508187 RepID=A0AAN7T965_9PEZI|nr:hypothetical protein LTR62_001642 [Meristemomyces frigidus]